MATRVASPPALLGSGRLDWTSCRFTAVGGRAHGVWYLSWEIVGCVAQFIEKVLQLMISQHNNITRVIIMEYKINTYISCMCDIEHITIL